MNEIYRLQQQNTGKKIYTHFNYRKTRLSWEREQIFLPVQKSWLERKKTKVQYKPGIMEANKKQHVMKPAKD